MTNLIAIVVVTILSTIIGALWYGPLFGKAWMKLSKISPKQIQQAKKKGMAKAYVLQFIATLVMFYVLSWVITSLVIVSSVNGAITGFIMWLGFIATTFLGMVLWDTKPMGLFWINSLHYLVTLVIGGAILAVWV